MQHTGAKRQFLALVLMIGLAATEGAQCSARKPPKDPHVVPVKRYRNSVSTPFSAASVAHERVPVVLQDTVAAKWAAMDWDWPGFASKLVTGEPTGQLVFRSQRSPIFILGAPSSDHSEQMQTQQVITEGGRC